MDRSKIQYGARQAIHTCLGVRPKDRTTIITDEEKRSLVEYFVQEIEQHCQEAPRVFVMEDFGDRPNDGVGALVFPQELKEALRNSDVSLYLAGSKRGEVHSFRTPMLETIEAAGTIRHAHMPGLTEEMMETGMAADYEEVRRLSRKIYETVTDAKEIRVTNRAGTDCLATFCHRWVISDGFITPEIWMNLPAGEVFTCPDTVDGVVVVDGILGDSFSETYGLLKETPLTLEIEGAFVKNLHCENKALEEEFRKYIAQDQNASRIGEFAIGTNIGLKELVGSLLQDEKFPGIHMAVGEGYPYKTGSDIYSMAHADGVLLEPNIYVDGRCIMESGAFLLEW